jgi:outer membrane protein TolC
MKWNKLILGTALASLLCSQVEAQSAVYLTLNDAVARSVQNSHQLAASKARIEAAAASLREAKERRLPDVNIQGALIRVNKPTVDLKVPLGGGSGSGGGQSSESGSSSNASVDQVVFGMANLSLPLYTGGKIRYGIESAQYLEKAARLDAENDRDAVVENTIAAYTALYKAHAALQLVQENLKSAQQRTSEFSALERNGVLARNELLKAQLQQSNIGLSLLEAESNVRTATLTLNLLTGLPEESILTVDSSGFMQQTAAGTLTEWEAKALQSRRDVQAVDLRRQASETAVKAVRADYLPNIALTGGYVAADVHNFLTVTNAVNAGLGLKYSPSSLWKTSAKIAVAKARLAEAEANEATLNDVIRQQVYNAYHSYVLSLRKIEVYDTAVEQAQEAYRIVKNKYENSLATTTELLDADVAQLQARLSRAYAQADATVAYSRLQQVAGDLSITQ